MSRTLQPAADHASHGAAIHGDERTAARRRALAVALRYVGLGIVFGIVLVKSEAVSWYRMQEMFRFQSIHMYGIFATAIATGALGIFLIKRFHWKSLDGEQIAFTQKDRRPQRYVLGGLAFGFGWGLTGICPGPMAALIGGGYSVVLIVLASAVVGTWTYGRLRSRLPH